MDLKVAAALTKEILEARWVKMNLLHGQPRDLACSNEHLQEMLEKILTDVVVGEKAHRWLGWVQGVIVTREGGTLEDFKTTNRN